MNQVQDAPQSKTSHIIGRELLAAGAAGILYPFGLIKDRHQTRRAAAQRTVVFVHGYGANRSSFYPLALYLRAHGIRNILNFDYASGGGIERAAIELRNFLRQRVRGGRIDLVCHSLGGLIARVYLQELGGARRVDQCITIGTPHRGTYNAYWLFSRVGRELRPESPLLARIKTSQKNSTRVKFLAIIGESDNIILPRASGKTRRHILRVPAVGHLGLLFSPTVFHAVLNRLQI